MMAVAQHGEALQFAALELRNDMEILKVVLSRHWEAQSERPADIMPFAFYTFFVRDESTPTMQRAVFPHNKLGSVIHMPNPCSLD